MDKLVFKVWKAAAQNHLLKHQVLHHHNIVTLEQQLSYNPQNISIHYRDQHACCTYWDYLCCKILYWQPPPPTLCPHRPVHPRQSGNCSWYQHILWCKMKEQYLLNCKILLWVLPGWRTKFRASLGILDDLNIKNSYTSILNPLSQ